MEKDNVNILLEKEISLYTEDQDFSIPIIKESIKDNKQKLDKLNKKKQKLLDFIENSDRTISKSKDESKVISLYIEREKAKVDLEHLESEISELFSEIDAEKELLIDAKIDKEKNDKKLSKFLEVVDSLEKNTNKNEYRLNKPTYLELGTFLKKETKKLNEELFVYNFFKNKLISKYPKKSIAYLNKDIKGDVIELKSVSDRVKKQELLEYVKDKLDMSLVTNFYIHKDSTTIEKILVLVFVDQSELPLTFPTFISPVIKEKSIPFNLICKEDKTQYYDGDFVVEQEGANGLLKEYVKYYRNSDGEFDVVVEQTETLKDTIDEVRLYKTKPKTKTVKRKPSPEIVYIPDKTLPFGERITESELKEETVEIVTSYLLDKDTGNVEERVTEKRISGGPKVVRYSSKTKFYNEKITKKDIIYKLDTNSDLPPGEKRVVPGKDGKSVKKKEFQQSDLGLVMNNDIEVHDEMIPEVVTVSARPSVERINFVPREEYYVVDENSQLPAGSRSIVYDGNDGYTVRTTTFDITKSGDLKTIVSDIVVNPVSRVVGISIKPSTKILKTIPFLKVYKSFETDDFELGSIVKKETGQKGKIVLKTTYSLDKDFSLKENHSKEKVPPKDETIYIATKTIRKKIRDIEPGVEYRAINDNSFALGTKSVVSEGVSGAVYEMTKYTVNEKTGELIVDKSEEIVDAKPKVIAVYLQDKVEIFNKVEHDTIYIGDPDSTLPAGRIIQVEQGQSGYTERKTKYKLEKDGTISVLDSSTIYKQPKDTVITVSTKKNTRIRMDLYTRKISETTFDMKPTGQLIPFTTHVWDNPALDYIYCIKIEILNLVPCPTKYNGDKTLDLPLGTQIVEDYGSDGYTTRIVTYKANKKTGETYDGTSEDIISIPTGRVVKVAIKPSVEKTLEHLGESKVIEKTKTTEYFIDEFTGEISSVDKHKKEIKSVSNKKFAKNFDSAISELKKKN